jgi:DNA-binding transcriptional MocR family regulator
VRAGRRSPEAAARRGHTVDLSMNLPPEPTDPALLERMRAGFDSLRTDLVALLRYQEFGGTAPDKDAASIWLGRRALLPAQSRVFIVPGAHAALLGIVGTLAGPGDTVLSEAITYPGVRAIAARLGITLVGLPMDARGIDPDGCDAACRRLRPKALYLNPTLQNPTTLTVPQERRAELVAVARRHGMPIIEDDAYGFIPVRGPAPFAALAGDLTWHVAGLAKCIGAGVRAAYVIAPSAQAGWPFAAAVRMANVMASPLTVALATRWIEDGTADAILDFIRAETVSRQRLASETMPAGSYRADPLSFNLWVDLPAGWTRSAFVGHMRATGIGVVPSDAFIVAGAAPEAVRVCLGGPADRAAVSGALNYMAHALTHPPTYALGAL